MRVEQPEDRRQSPVDDADGRRVQKESAYVVQGETEHLAQERLDGADMADQDDGVRVRSGQLFHELHHSTLHGQQGLPAWRGGTGVLSPGEQPMSFTRSSARNLGTRHAIPFTERLLDQTDVLLQRQLDRCGNRLPSLQAPVQRTAEDSIDSLALEYLGELPRLVRAFTGESFVSPTDEGKSSIGSDLAVPHQEQA